MNRVANWRIAVAVLILAGLVFFLATFTPYYIRNYQLQRYVSDLTRRVGSENRSDDVVRTMVLEKGRELGLPVTEDEVHVTHPPDGLRVEIRYAVRVDVPGYTVNLHFYPVASTN